MHIGAHEFALWEEYSGNGTAVAMCRVPPDETPTVSRHQLPVFGDQTAIAVVDDSIVMARVDPVSQEVLVSLLDENLRAVSRRSIAEHADSVAISSTDGGAVIAWIHGQRGIRPRWLSPGLDFSSPILTIAEVDVPTTVSGLQLAASGGSVAVVYRTLTLEDARVVAGATSPVLEPLRGTHREAVALVEKAAAAVTGPVWLDPPSAGAATAAWLGPEVWILHGTVGVVTRIVP